MSAPTSNPGLARVQHIRHLIVHHSLSASAFARGLLRLIARYEELDAEITRFSDVDRLSTAERAADRPRSAEYRRAGVYTRILRSQLEATAGVLELLWLELEGEIEA